MLAAGGQNSVAADRRERPGRGFDEALVKTVETDEYWRGECASISPTRGRRWSSTCLTVVTGPWRWLAARPTGWTAWRIHANPRRFGLLQLVPAANTRSDRSQQSVNGGVPFGALPRCASCL